MNYSILSSKEKKTLILTGSSNYTNEKLAEIVQKYNVNSLVFDYYHNENIDSIPNSIKKLVLGKCFNKPIDNLPIGLEELQINYRFNQSLDFLPCSLKILTIKDFPPEEISNFQQGLDNLPSNLKELCLPYLSYSLKRFNNLPKNLEKIKIGSDYKYIQELLNIHGEKVVEIYANRFY